MTKLRVTSTGPTEIAARNAALDAVRPFADLLGPSGLLAVMACTVGHLIALQDQRTMTPDMAMDLVLANIVEGNKEAIAKTLGQTEGAA